MERPPRRRWRRLRSTKVLIMIEISKFGNKVKLWWGLEVVILAEEGNSRVGRSRSGAKHKTVAVIDFEQATLNLLWYWNSPGLGKNPASERGLLWSSKCNSVEHCRCSNVNYNVLCAWNMLKTHCNLSLPPMQSIIEALGPIWDIQQTQLSNVSGEDSECSSLVDLNVRVPFYNAIYIFSESSNTDKGKPCKIILESYTPLIEVYNKEYG